MSCQCWSCWKACLSSPSSPIFEFRKELLLFWAMMRSTTLSWAWSALATCTQSRLWLFIANPAARNRSRMELSLVHDQNSGSASLHVRKFTRSSAGWWESDPLTRVGWGHLVGREVRWAVLACVARCPSWKSALKNYTIVIMAPAFSSGKWQITINPHQS